MNVLGQDVITYQALDSLSPIQPSLAASEHQYVSRYTDGCTEVFDAWMLDSGAHNKENLIFTWGISGNVGKISNVTFCDQTFQPCDKTFIPGNILNVEIYYLCFLYKWIAVHASIKITKVKYINMKWIIEQI